MDGTWLLGGALIAQTAAAVTAAADPCAAGLLSVLVYVSCIVTLQLAAPEKVSAAAVGPSHTQARALTTPAWLVLSVRVCYPPHPTHTPQKKQAPSAAPAAAAADKQGEGEHKVLTAVQHAAKDATTKLAAAGKAAHEAAAGAEQHAAKAVSKAATAAGRRGTVCWQSGRGCWHMLYQHACLLSVLGELPGENINSISCGMPVSAAQPAPLSTTVSSHMRSSC